MDDSQPPLPPIPRNDQDDTRRRSKNFRIQLAILLLLTVVFGIVVVGTMRNHRAANLMRCRSNIEQLGEALRMYKDESRGGLYPVLSDEPGRLMFIADGPMGSRHIYPEYLTDLSVFLCPSDSGTKKLLPATRSDTKDPAVIIDDHSYFYLGYDVRNDEEMVGFAVGYKKQIAEGGTFLQTLQVPEGTGILGSNVYLRQRDFANVFIFDPGRHSKPVYPVLIERPENHKPAGGHVLFRNGHVEFIEYPGKWPMTKKTIDILISMDDLGDKAQALQK